jgi:hypothetical protein
MNIQANRSPEHNNDLLITIDGAPAGTFDGETYTPAEGMTKKAINAATKFLRGLTSKEEAPGGAEVVGNPPPPSGRPPMPEADPMLGDKTPELVEWYRDNDPDEYARRYRGRKTHLGRIG